MTDYSTMTQDDFDNILEEVLGEMSAIELLTQVPSIHSDIIEEFNNEVLDRWSAKQDQHDN